MTSTSHVTRRGITGALVLALSIVLAATPAGAHVPGPIWGSPDVTIEIPDVPTALDAVAMAVAGPEAMWTVDSVGVVTAHGDAVHHGDLAETTPGTFIVGMAATPTGLGYWLAEEDGTVWAFGDAAELGDVSHLPLDQPIVTMAATSTGDGFWLAAADGGMFTFGDAVFHGSAAIYDLVSPIVGMTPTSDDLGYWLVAGDGGVFTFGEAEFHGSMGAIDLDAEIVAMAATPDDLGYWLAGADGGIFTLGTAAFDGSGVGQVTGLVTDMERVNDDDYVLAVGTGVPTLPEPGADAQAYYDSLSASQIQIWDDMAQCESGQRWDINTGNGYYGGLQFSPGSWAAVGGSGLPHQHSRIEQIYRGALLQQVQGWGAWPGCSSRLGLL